MVFPTYIILIFEHRPAMPSNLFRLKQKLRSKLGEKLSSLPKRLKKPFIAQSDAPTTRFELQYGKWEKLENEAPETSPIKKSGNADA
jgi:hypothetical protein